VRRTFAAVSLVQTRRIRISPGPPAARRGGTSMAPAFTSAGCSTGDIKRLNTKDYSSGPEWTQT
jgi:hypothetical protein